MNQFFEKYPWLRTMLCGLMAAALLLSVLLPVLRLQRQEPENPIREENIQPVEPLSFGEAEGGTRLSAPEQTEDGPGGGQTQPENAKTAHGAGRNGSNTGSSARTAAGRPESAAARKRGAV